MKLISYLSAAAFVGLGVFLLALALDAGVLGSYAATASVLIVLGAVRDYSPRRSHWEPGQSRTTRFPASSDRPSDRLAA